MAGFRFWGFALCLAGYLLISGGCHLTDYASRDYIDPTRFEKDIARFEARDAESPPPEGAVVCVGSSSMRMWAGRIGNDLAPLTVIPRGFGGSNMNDLLHYSDRLILAYRPRAVLIYEGDNDIAQRVRPGKIGRTFEKLVGRIHEQLPDCRIYMLSIKPSPKRWGMWKQMVEANRLLKKTCDQDPLLTYIDIATPMLGEGGNPLAELYIKDRLHMSAKGYDVWRDAVYPVLVAAEGRFEPNLGAGGDWAGVPVGRAVVPKN